MDFTASNHGSIILLTPLTAEANTWVDEHLPEDVQTLGRSIAIEPRYFDDIVEGIRADGLSIN